MSDQLTVILPTYNRPVPLAAAVRSVLRQSFTDWRLLVIGDKCDERTQNVMDSFRDPRISYINLPERFGEQSGPNSVGISLTETPYLAFLNHDDILLANHFSYGLSCLQQSGAEFFVGRCAFTRCRGELEGMDVLFVDEIPPARRHPRDIFLARMHSFEPCSMWILKTSTAQKIGLWNYHGDIFRPPLQDYILRAWRMNVRFAYGEQITTWSVCTIYKSGAARVYDTGDDDHRLAERLLEGLSAEQAEDLLLSLHAAWNDLPADELKRLTSENDRWQKGTGRVKHSWWRSLIKSFVAQVFKWTGIDAFVLHHRLKGGNKGDLLRGLLVIRTGEHMPAKPDLERIVQQIKSSTEGQPQAE